MARIKILLIVAGAASLIAWAVPQGLAVLPPPTSCSATWGQLAVPNPSINGSTYLLGMTAFSTTDAWVVGSESVPGQPSLTEHWDGSSWAVVPSQNPSIEDQFLGVSGSSSTDVWAVGIQGDGSEFPTLIEHWDGAAWSTVPSPSGALPVNQLLGVDAISSVDAW